MSIVGRDSESTNECFMGVGGRPKWVMEKKGKGEYIIPNIEFSTLS